MPLPKRLARFNRHATNRALGPIAERMPGFAIVEHVGRRSGRAYRTPVAAFARNGMLTIALTYGPDSEWVRNVLAADGCDVRMRGRSMRMRDPRLVHDETRRAVPTPVRTVLRLMGVADFLQLTVNGALAS
jgi:deazaflavin-dependent oxidoreductase (nitroreductase family)